MLTSLTIELVHISALLDPRIKLNFLGFTLNFYYHFYPHDLPFLISKFLHRLQLSMFFTPAILCEQLFGVTAEKHWNKTTITRNLTWLLLTKDLLWNSNKKKVKECSSWKWYKDNKDEENWFKRINSSNTYSVQNFHS